jgi:anti-sigma-K factor RskA
MTDRDDTYALALAYVYGEMDTAESRAFEARLDGDAELRAEVDGLVATRDLLKMDARYGEESGVDLPPPHLADAILRAEALSRPPEIRAAVAKASGEGSGSSWVQKLSLWLVGGGVAVTAAAAVLLFTTTGDEMAPEAAALEAPAAAEPAASADRFLAEKASATGASADGLLEEAKAAPEPAEPPPPAEGAESAGDDGDAMVGGKAADMKPDLAAAPPADAPKLDAPATAAFGDARGDKGGVAGLDFAKDQADAEADEDAPARARGFKAEAPLGSSGPGGGGGGFAAGRASGAPAKSAAQPMPVADSAPEAEPTPAPAAKKPATRGPPPMPGIVKELTKRKAKRRSPRVSKKAEFRQQTRDAERENDANFAFATGDRELTAGRYLDALDEFRKASKLDRTGKLLGIGPYLGMMKAYQGLKDHRSVLGLLPTVRKPGLKAPGVADGLLVAAVSAEALGDWRQAERLYKDLLPLKAYAARAQAGLDRVYKGSAKLRSRAMDDAAMESAAEAPAEAESSNE